MATSSSRAIRARQPVMREYVGAARPAGARDIFGEVSVQAEGADSHRDVPEARRFRGAHRRVARHDRRARRVLWPRGDARFAESPAAGRLQLGADAVARAGARDDAAAVEAARAAMADRRHLHLRGEARVACVGARGGALVCRRVRARRAYEPARAERGVPGSREDFARLLRGFDPHRAHRRQIRHGRASQAARRRTAKDSKAKPR